MTRVMVLGGRGLMGRRILRLLRQAMPKAELICAGREEADVEGATFARFDMREPEDYGAALRGVDVLINTVGPFTYDPGPIVRVCRDNGCHYVDLAETPAFMRGVREIARGFPAGSVACVTGCSSVPALVEVYARRWRGRADVARVRAQLSIGTNNEASATLLYSMLLPVGRERPDGGRWFDHIWRREHAGLPARRYSTYPSSLEETGVNLGDRIVPLSFGFGFDRAAYTTALWLLTPLVASTPRWLLRTGSRAGAALSPLLRPLGTKIGIMAIDALDARGESVDSVAIIARANGLDVPAWPSVWAVQVLAGSSRSGSISLADLITPRQATEKLTESGYTVCEF